jgi:hypothetical protein
MVDFNNEATVAQNAADIIKIIIIERRYNVHEALEHYLKRRYDNADTGPEFEVLKARLYILYIELRETCIRILKDKRGDAQLKELERQLTSTEFNDILAAINTINSILDKIKLTRLDLYQTYDYTNIEAANEARGA